jgi:tetratricopeptide (TPR) repeat protein
MLLARGQWQDAEKYLGRAEADFRDLVKSRDEPDDRLTLGTVLINRVDLYWRSGRAKAKEAEALGKEAVSLLGALAKERPAQPLYAREQARALHNLGVVYTTRERYADAEAQHRLALAIRQGLADKHKEEPAYRQELATSHAELAIALARQNRHEAAIENFTKAIALLEDLHARYGAEVAYVNELSAQLRNLMSLLGGLGRDDDELKHWRRVNALAEWLADRHPTAADYRAAVGRELHGYAARLMELRRWADARAAYEKASKQQREALKLDPRDKPALMMLPMHLLGVAETWVAEKDHARAARAAADAVAEAPATWPHYPAAAAALARCVPLALSDEKLPEAKRKEVAKGYGDRAVELLRKAMAAGFKDAESVRKAKEFEPLRGREDFTKLLAEMGKK